MKVSSITENISIEKRIAITPETAKKFISNGFKINLPKNYAKHLGFNDDEYKALDVNILDDDKDVINSDILVQLGLPTDNNLEYFKEDQILVGSLGPFLNKEKIDLLLKKKLKIFH